jgi:ABC-type sugar transport system ATPase subunit
VSDQPTKVRDPSGPAAVAGPEAIAVRGVRRSFGDTHALDGCDLTALPGEIHALVGENGSGKSTLVKILSGVLRHDAGTVEVLGRPVERVTPRTMIERGVSTVFQEVLVADGATVADNVFMGVDGLLRRRISPQARRTGTAEVMERLLGRPLDPLALVDGLSLSVRQWITIARALVREPRVLILDESTAALDLAASARLLQELERLKRGGTAILLITHRIAELSTFADRATVLRDGRTAGTLAGDDTSEARLLELMGTAKLVEAGTRAPRGRSQGAPGLAATELVLAAGAEPFALGVQRGEILGLAGLEGHGQVAFLETLAGLRAAHAGTVTDRAGAPVAGPRGAVRAGIAYVPGDRKREGIFPHLSIAENFALPSYTRLGRAGILSRRRIARDFEPFGRSLSLRMPGSAAPIGALSGGNQQKVVVARWLATRPDVVLLNDPTRGIDMGAKRDLYGVLDELARDGTAVVLLSTEIEELLTCCDRVAVFRDASLAAELMTTGASVADVLAAMFGTRHDNTEKRR